MLPLHPGTTSLHSLLTQRGEQMKISQTTRRYDINSKQQPYENLNAAGKPSFGILKRCPKYTEEGKLSQTTDPVPGGWRSAPRRVSRLAC